MRSTNMKILKNFVLHKLYQLLNLRGKKFKNFVMNNGETLESIQVSNVISSPTN